MKSFRSHDKRHDSNGKIFKAFTNDIEADLLKMSDIDFQIVDVENELEKRRNEQPDSVSARSASSSRLGCVSVLGYLILGMVIFRLLLEFLQLIG